MMRVVIEMHPGGDASRKKTVASFDIANVSELAEESNYTVVGKTDRLGVFRTSIENHMRSHGWIPLLKRILDRLAEAER